MKLPDLSVDPTNVQEALFHVAAHGYDIDVESWNDTLEFTVSNRPWDTYVAHRSLPDLTDPAEYERAIVDCVCDMRKYSLARQVKESMTDAEGTTNPE